MFHSSGRMEIPRVSPFTAVDRGPKWRRFPRSEDRKWQTVPGVRRA
jgi:hypothetical protein